MEGYLRKHFSFKKKALNADFTFNLLTEGWAHGSIGCRTLHRPSREKISQKYCPFVFCMTRTENEAGYTAMIEGIRLALGLMGLVSEPSSSLLDDYPIDAVTLDNSDAGANAFLFEWDNYILITLCWTHIKMGALPKNRDKLTNPRFYDEAQDGLDCLQVARSVPQELILRDVLIKYWRSKGEGILADYVETYIFKPNRYISVNASGVKNHNNSSQAEESGHRSYKRGYFGQGGEKLILFAYFPYLIFWLLTGPVTIGTFCHCSIDNQLKDSCEQVENYPLIERCDGRINRSCLCRAFELVYQNETPFLSNYFKVTEGMGFGRNYAPLEHSGYVFNGSDMMWQKDDLHHMNSSRAKLFLLSLRGILTASTVQSFRKSCDTCLNAHFVKIVDGEAICDCVAFCSKSECAHSTAAMHLEGMLNISEELQRIQNGRLPGRPKQYKPMGYAGVVPAIQEEAGNLVITEHEAANYIGVMVAKRFLPDLDIYLGRISNFRLTPGDKRTPQRIVWTVEYDDDNEEMEYAEMLRAKNLYVEVEHQQKRYKPWPHFKAEDD